MQRCTDALRLSLKTVAQQRSGAVANSQETDAKRATQVGIATGTRAPPAPKCSGAPTFTIMYLQNNYTELSKTEQY